MTTAAEFYGDPEILDELAVMYGADVVSLIVPTVMGMLLVRGAGASSNEKLRIFHEDLRHSVPSVLRRMGDPAHIERYLNQMMDDGISRSRKIFPAVDAFMRGEVDDFMRNIFADFDSKSQPESG